MRNRPRHQPAPKIGPQLASLIDVVFLLLIFFVMTLRVAEPEGNFNLNAPMVDYGGCIDCGGHLPPIKVGLVANADGSLGSILLNGKSLGSGEEAFARLSNGILKIIVRPGNPLTKDIEVEIEADYKLQYQYTIRAVSACTGRMETTADGDAKLIRYVEKIKFAPPKKPEGTA